MRRLRLTACLLLLTLSCTGPAVKQQTAGSPPAPDPPAVTGTVTLAFRGNFGTPGDIRSPWGLSFGMDGTLYVCDRDKSTVVRLDAAGAVISRFDSFTNRTERLYAPVDVCSSSGIGVYAIDATYSRVIRFDRNLKNGYTIYRGRGDNSRLFGSFSGLAYDTVSGDLYITDRDTGAVIRKDMLGGSIRSMGAFGSDRKSLREPAGIDIGGEGELYIADRGYGAVAALHHFGADIGYIGSDVLEAPVDVAVLPGKHLAVADRHGIVILSIAGRAEACAGFSADRPMMPRSLAYREGSLYVSDGISASILVYSVVLP